MTGGEELECGCHFNVLGFVSLSVFGTIQRVLDSIHSFYMYRIFHVPPSLPPSLSTVYSYSSLDGMDDTFPNSHLAITTDTTCVARQPGVTSGYLPAYMLANESHERAGRTAR